MNIAMVGLGRMGMNMGRRLLRGGHHVVAYNRTPSRSEELATEGAQAVHDLGGIAAALKPPRLIWLMLPAGSVVDEHLAILKRTLDPGDVVVDGGNSHYLDSLRRSPDVAEAGLRYLDVGTSGGIHGLTSGYCLMVGGDREDFLSIEPVLETLATKGGYLYCGPTGAGHYAKMIHNGIEYALMQSYAEGFSLLNASPYGRHTDLGRLCSLWNNGSIIRSFLLELAGTVFSENAELSGIEPAVEDSGEGRWAVQEALRLGRPAPLITQALMERFRSRERNSFAYRLLSALRGEFGGHEVRASTDRENVGSVEQERA
jgi:6-phosphogluconate dehydrogenase